MFAFYSLDTKLFIDYDRSDKENNKYYPKLGVPTALARVYSIYGLLWGNFQFLKLDTEELEISWVDFVVLWFFSIF
jgi:hypothetical protein